MTLPRETRQFPLGPNTHSIPLFYTHVYSFLLYKYTYIHIYVSRLVGTKGQTQTIATNRQVETSPGLFPALTSDPPGNRSENVDLSLSPASRRKLLPQSHALPSLFQHSSRLFFFTLRQLCRPHHPAYASSANWSASSTPFDQYSQRQRSIPVSSG